jgi:hypothetical protein
MTNSQMVRSQGLKDKVIITTGIDIDVCKKMISWINAGKNGRELG